jgi:hypothetical protein
MATVDQRLNSLSVACRQLNSRNQQLMAAVAGLLRDVADLKARPRTITEEIDAIPGRRIESVFSGEVTFTINDLGQRGKPVIIQISQDGPFIMCFYPMVLWRPSAPDDATNFGRWRPVRSFPLPTQVVQTDIIDIGYELQDGGNQRLFQNDVRGPILSQPDNILPCAVPTEWSPNAAINLYPTYFAIDFNGSPTPPTAGILHVDLIGYRIVNM